jgi:hypothetical protein
MPEVKKNPQNSFLSLPLPVLSLFHPFTTRGVSILTRIGGHRCLIRREPFPLLTPPPMLLKKIR